jgi:D-sedoheptulose 7-phosphate isomerase
MGGSVNLGEAVRKARNVYIIGNGGSYANAMHLCNDLLECGIPAFILDPASITRVANDEDYQYVFSKWIYTVGKPGDLLIALSGSGTSKNVVNALEAARIRGVETYCVFGDFNDHPQAENVFTAGEDMQSAEELQIVIGHEVRKWLKSS